MRLFISFLSVLFVLTQVGGFRASEEDMQQLSCSEATLNEVLGLCKGHLCEVTQTKLQYKNKEICGYGFLNPMESPPLRSHQSYEKMLNLKRDLQPCTKYNTSYSLYAKDGSVVDGPFLEETIVPAKAPLGVRNFNATPDESGNIALTWEPPETGCYVSFYNITYKHTDLQTLAEYPEKHEKLLGKEHETVHHLLADVLTNALYEICVTSSVEEQDGRRTCVKVRTPEKDSLQQATTVSLPPPRSISLTSRNSTSLTMTWEPPENNTRIEKYELTVSEAQTTDAPLTKYSVNSSIVTYTVGRLLPGTRYTVAVRVVFESGAGAEATETFTTEHVREEKKTMRASDKPVFDFLSEAVRSNLEEPEQSGYSGNAASLYPVFFENYVLWLTFLLPFHTLTTVVSLACGNAFLIDVGEYLHCTDLV